jgi:A/G-specific adenine glycosylase
MPELPIPNADAPSPATCRILRRRLLAWYARHQRRLPWRQTADPYHIWLSEVMLQQTQVKTVLPYYARFIRAFPDLPSLARADAAQVLKLWEGLGYYRRAHHLHAAARRIVADGRAALPNDRQAFRALPGVGEYIANAVMSIAFGQACAVVDGNVKRVLARLLAVDAPVNQPAAHPIYQQLADLLLDRRAPGAFNQALMELGALICTPRNPSCDRCPLVSHCRAYAADVVDRFPRRVARKPAPLLALVAGIVEHRGRLLVVRRPTEGLLGGLWEFPNGKRKDLESAAETCRRHIRYQTGLEVRVLDKIATVRHAYTHFKIAMAAYRCHKASGRVQLQGPTAFRWLSPTQLDSLAFTGASRKLFAALRALFPGP